MAPCWWWRWGQRRGPTLTPLPPHPTSPLPQVNRGAAVVTMAKKDLHPVWHPEAKVVCNGEEVLTTSGTKNSYTGAPGACGLAAAAD